MAGTPFRLGAPGAERALERVARRLHRHEVWDLALLVVPPVGAALYVLFSLAIAGYLGLAESAAVGAATLAGAALVLGLTSIRKAPSVRHAARLIDLRVRGQERFLTVATVDPAGHPEPLLARLKAEASALASRLRLQADFPYRPKRSSLLSLAASFLALAVFQLLLPHFGPSGPPAARKAERRQELLSFDRADGMRKLFERLRDPALSLAEKKELIEKLRDQLAREAGWSEQEKALARERLEQPERDLSQGGGQAERQDRGAGGIESNLPEESKGDQRKSGSGGSGEELGATEKSGKQRNEKTTNAEGQGQEPKPSEADKGGRSPQEGERKTKGEAPGVKRGEGAGGAGQPDQMPQSPPPDRFYPAGQGERRLKGAGYVTVELPEAEEASHGGSGKEIERKIRRPRVPVGNAPLPPAAGPEAAREKQPLPLEYRDIIR